MNVNITDKQRLHDLCVYFVDTRISTIKRQIQSIQESLHSETKSSAGDKHETGRAMLQLEREKAGQQLAEAEQLKVILSKIDPTRAHGIIALGSVVYTSQARYFIAISAGTLQVGSKTFYAISPNTPIGKLLIGKRVTDVIEFREQRFVIERVM